jgi:hypothetical protein
MLHRRKSHQGLLQHVSGLSQRPKRDLWILCESREGNRSTWIEPLIRSSQLVNSVISSLPTYYMCSLKLLATVIEIHKHSKNYLWRGKEFRHIRKKEFRHIRKPKNKGGLGVINSSVHNGALLLK